MGRRREVKAMLRLASGLLLAIAIVFPSAGAQDFQRGPARSPHGSIAIPCLSCHTSTSWTPLRAVPEFNHNTDTSFSLRGLHENVQCRLCHTKPVFSNAGTKCADCHADIHRRQFGARCDECHTVKGWRVGVDAIRSHQNRFPLLGAHSMAECDSCHKGAAAAQYTGLSTECASCHVKDYQQAGTVNHQAAAFPLDCRQCHSFDSWRMRQFDHTRFAHFQLDGAHSSLECSACHAGGRYSGLTADCFGCHAKDFASVKSVEHVKAGFPRDCTSCHSTAGWQGAQFDHGALTKFQLTGAHARVECASCHVGGRFAGTRADCYGCHVGNYESVKNPDHVKSSFPTDCASCHATSTWQNATFNHALARFPLTGAHMQASCTQCHVGGQYTGISSQCSNCHLANFQKTTNPNHVTAGFPQDCSLCHTTAQWAGAAFNHTTKTTFPLTGSHVPLSCTQCHSSGRFAGLSTQCASCHLPNYQKTTNPNHVAAGFAQDCAACHTTAQWAGVKFDHSTKTTFPLTGAHVPLACNLCHASGVYAGLSTQCVSCHLPNYQKTTNPNHAAAGFPQDCAACHTTAQWTGVKFDHSKAKFALTGSHVALLCTQCHSSGQFAGLPSQCVSCHLPNYQKTTNPNHVTAGFPQDCSLCHTTAQWVGAKFDHGKTKFALTGSHVPLACTQCHSSGQYAGLSTQCAACHLPNYQKTTNPNHVTAGFPQDCALCHTTAQWAGAKFDHGKTKFALTGSHVPLACTQCHSSGQYAGLSTQCASCHLPNYQKTTNPNHAPAGFSQDCAACHTTVQWAGAKFDHSKAKFPLTGSHVALLCTQCHSSGQFAGLPSQCVSCHLPDYQKTTNPNHVTAGFPQDCTLCHTTAQWTGATFNHTTKTTFPLTGSHVPLACNLCHSSGVYAGLPTACVSCHLPNYQKTTNPNHVAAVFPQDCTLCHTTAQWTGATFNHTTKTTFPLTGAHVPLACNLCHSSGVYAGLSTQCVSCHLPNYQKTTSPNHVAAAFPQDCAACHTTTQWTGATFNHTTKTTFPLTGAHVPLTCNLCHSSGKYAGLSTACVSCHLPNYQKTTNPNHVTAAFPQDCTLCHTTTLWTGATFNHTTKTTFPLTGAHVSLTCNLCHSSGVYAGLSTQCVSCHLSNYQKTTNPNHVAAAFPQNCVACHTTTQWTGATFNHTTSTTFPLVGMHVGLACNLCHSSGVYVGLATTCVSCHLANYQKTTNPNHVTAGFPQDCALCHTPAAQWTGATFNHTTQTTFPLTGTHLQATCIQCHSSGVYKGLATTCASCHLATYQATTNPKHSAAGFPQDCSVCHSTTNWLGATFNHATLLFPLVGMHVGLACTSCHASGVYVGLATTCVSCHLAKYQATTSPNHTTAGFPQQCELCHTPTGWTPSSFNHATTVFPLTGFHTTVACASCHVGGKYVGTPTDCYSCHKTMYGSTTNPGHAAAGFPTTCQTCHTTTSWAGATFNHTWFPSTHHGAAGCSTCHTNPADYKVFQCTGCHAKATTDSHHSGRTGYVYNSTNCYACHPRGSAG